MSVEHHLVLTGDMNSHFTAEETEAQRGSRLNMSHGRARIRTLHL